MSEPTGGDVSNWGTGALGGWSSLGRAISDQAGLEAVHASDGVLAAGDSTLYITVGALAQIANSHGTNFGVNAWSGRPTRPAVDWLESVANQDLLPSRLLLECGSNDIFDSSAFGGIYDPDKFGAQVERMMQLAGPDRTVWWVTPYVGRFDATAPVRESQVLRSGWLTIQLQEVAQQYPNLVLIDWYRWIGEAVSNGSPLQNWRIRSGLSDGVHTKAWGSVQRNALVEAALWPA